MATPQSGSFLPTTRLDRAACHERFDFDTLWKVPDFRCNPQKSGKINALTMVDRIAGLLACPDDIHTSVFSQPLATSRFLNERPTSHLCP